MRWRYHIIYRFPYLTPRGPSFNRIYDAYIQYTQGSWDSVIVKVGSFDVADRAGDFVGYSDASSDRHLATQLKHFALVQVGRAINAAVMGTAVPYCLLRGIEI